MTEMRREVRLAIPKKVHDNLKSLADLFGASPSRYCETLVVETVNKVVVNAVRAELAARASLVCR